MNMKRSFPLGVPMFACVFVFFGCATLIPTYDWYSAKYNISLAQVERPAEAKKRYGEQRIEKIQEEGIHKYFFEDEMVRVLCFVGVEQVNFMLENKTEHSIKIIWDEAAYVDIDGSSHRVMHSGVKYSDRNAPQPPTVVVRRGKVSDIVCPADYCYYRKGYYSRYSSVPGGWENKPLLPSIERDNVEALRTKANDCVGKSIQVLLPLKIEDVVNDYIFTFRINSVEVTKTTERLRENTASFDHGELSIKNVYPTG